MTAVAGVVVTTSALAQNIDSTLYLCVDDVVKGNSWLVSENSASLAALGRGAVSEATIGASTEHGEFINYNGADSQYEFIVGAESYVRINSRTSLHGRVGYRNFTGHNMAGSYLLNPEEAPFDMVEYTEENRGKKRLEQYEVVGSAAYSPLGWLTIGGGIDYQAANYAKRKDLRHTNFAMDMTVNAGLKFRIIEQLQVGVNYTYRRRAESILLSMYGTSDQTFASLISYGAMFGKREFFGDNGYTKENETKPLLDVYHGGAVQISWSITPDIEWFNEVGYRTRRGHYGDLSPYTVVYSNHGGAELFYKGALTIERNNDIHTVHLGWKSSNVSNRENLYEYVNEVGGLNYVEYLGEVETGARREQRVMLDYTARLDIEQGIAKWEIRASGEVNNRDIVANNFPDYRRQDILWWRAGIAAERNIRNLRNIYTVGLYGGYGGGSGEPFVDGHYGAAGSQTITRTLDNLLLREYEYLTSPQIRGSLSLDYGRYIGNRGVVGYVRAQYSWAKAFRSEHLGKAQRHIAEISVGCYF